VFRDDVDGTPSWARIRSAKGLHFVPLAGGKVTHEGGLSLAFDEQKILSEPDINVDRHMSVDQEEELRRYFGLSIPAQAGPPGTPGAGGPGAAGAGGPGQTQPGQVQPGAAARPGAPGRSEADLAGQAQAGQPAAKPTTAQPTAGAAQPGAGQPTAAQPGAGQPAGTAETRVDRQPAPAGDQPAQQWMIRSEERFAVNLETQEASRVRLRKYVETEPVEQTVKVFHEEYEIERVPISKDDQIGEDLAEGEQEIILREARAIITKESVPVERVRLSARKVEEDKTVRDELRRERIEVLGDDDQADRPASQSPAGQPATGRSPASPTDGPAPGQPRPPSGQPRR
jgi:stress response protein YsnF